MWELICHHTYKLNGLAVDLSDHNQHGQDKGTIFLPDGITPGSGALRVGKFSYVNIPLSSVWQTLGGLQIEMTVRINRRATSMPMGLINAGSFVFMIGGGDVLAFSYDTHQASIPGENREQIWSVGNHIGNSSYRIPFDQWVKLGVFHNGVDIMELYADGQLIARRTGLHSGIAGVGKSGVYVGLVIDTSVPDSFDIDELKIWRPDPKAMEKLFVSRQPVDAAKADCLEQLFNNMQEIFAKNPDCAQYLRANLPSEIERLRYAIGAKGDEAIIFLNETCNEYERLWKAGQLDSIEMEFLFLRWCNWMHYMGISLEGDPHLLEMLHSCLGEVIDVSALYKCDPQMTSLINLLVRACA